MKKVAFHTLGCKLNFSETSTLSRQLKARGFEQVAFENPADVYIINTCSVTDNADRKCRKIVRDAQKQAPQAFIAVIGCYAQLKPQEIASIPGVDAVLGAREKFQLPDLLEDFTKGYSTQVMACDIEHATKFHQAYSIDDRTRTFLKVQDGCDYSCAFCTIPLARGKSRSDTLTNVLQQAEKIAASGVKEIVLTGVNLGDYGIIEGARKARFLDLINALEQVDGLQRVRISSIEPNLLSSEIIDHVAGSEKFLPHFHIPLQSGSDRILKKMKRRYLTALYRDRVQQIKEVMPHSCIGADVIVGFPGESDADFKETHHFLSEQPVDYLHVFTYSERPNTLAESLPNALPSAIRSGRSKQLRLLSDKKRRAFYQQSLGQTRMTLIENDLSAGQLQGYTDNYIRVAVPFSPELINTIVPVTLIDLDPNSNAIGQIAAVLS